MQLIFVLVVFQVPLRWIDGVYECTTGKWGAQCTKTCGSCEGGAEFCHVYDGYCFNGCASGYTGMYCIETCPPGKYGQYCRHSCGLCSNVRPYCDRETGKCSVACQPGFQMPYCTEPCPFNTWGPGCDNQCQCSNTTSTPCGCDHETGDCLTCRNNPVHRYPVASPPKCLQEDKLTGKPTQYEAPGVLSFPFKPVLAVGSTVAMFVFGNFLWWWFMVRSPKPKEPPPEIKRGRKPPKRRTAKMARYRKVLGEYSKASSKPPTEKRRKSTHQRKSTVKPSESQEHTSDMSSRAFP